MKFDRCPQRRFVRQCRMGDVVDGEHARQHPADERDRHTICARPVPEADIILVGRSSQETNEGTRRLTGSTKSNRSLFALLGVAAGRAADGTAGNRDVRYLSRRLVGQGRSAARLYEEKPTTK
ncbi:hypothetical protein [Shinella zoogloeoides]|uniref:hypothetical protein n=1 Tax=Shinella zoogloeoides TaxID=352475 RepID=UPI00299DB529|nr:hypothetical protein [Shinella zoogloeoides]